MHLILLTSQTIFHVYIIRYIFSPFNFEVDHKNALLSETEL
jgi:hypothetical protein